MAVIESYIDEIVVIPEDIKKMTKEERQIEIAKLEAEAAKKKYTLNKHRKETA